jgi:hypothetical protein
MILEKWVNCLSDLPYCNLKNLYEIKRYGTKWEKKKKPSKNDKVTCKESPGM